MIFAEIPSSVSDFPFSVGKKSVNSLSEYTDNVLYLDYSTYIYKKSVNSLSEYTDNVLHLEYSTYMKKKSV